MELSISAFGNIRRFLPGGVETAVLTLTEGITVDDLVQELNIPSGEFWFATVNGSKVDGHCILKQDDQVTIFSPVGGG